MLEIVGARLGHDDDVLGAVTTIGAERVTFPGRTPGTSPVTFSMSWGYTLRPPTMMTSLMRPQTTSCPSTM